MRTCPFLLVQKRTKKGYQGDHPEVGFVAWKSALSANDDRADFLMVESAHFFERNFI
jgi:hypothetical protein